MSAGRRGPSPADQGVLALIDGPAFRVRELFAVGLTLVLPMRLVASLPAAAGQYLTWGIGNAPSPGRMMGGLVLTYGGLFVGMFIQALLYSALVRLVMRRTQGEATTVGQALRWALQPGVMFTVALIGVMGAVGSSLCLVPGLAVAAWLGLAIPVMAAEDVVGGKAMDRAMVLARHGVRGQWFTSTAAITACIFVTWGMVSYAVGSMVILPAGVYGGYIGVKAAMEGASVADPSAFFPPWMTAVVNVGAALSYAFSDLYLASGLVLAYRRVRDLVEGADLIEALDRAGAPGPEGVGAPGAEP